MWIQGLHQLQDEVHHVTHHVVGAVHESHHALHALFQRSVHLVTTQRGQGRAALFGHGEVTQRGGGLEAQSCLAEDLAGQEGSHTANSEAKPVDSKERLNHRSERQNL